MINCHLLEFAVSVFFGGSEGSRTLYLSACKADAIATLEPRTHKNFFLSPPLKQAVLLDNLEAEAPVREHASLDPTKSLELLLTMQLSQSCWHSARRLRPDPLAAQAA